MILPEPRVSTKKTRDTHTLMYVVVVGEYPHSEEEFESYRPLYVIPSTFLKMNESFSGFPPRTTKETAQGYQSY